MKGFTDIARFAAETCGAEGLAIAEYPVAIGIQDPEKIRDTVKDFLIDQIIEGLTESKSEAGSSDTGTPEEVASWSPEKIVFSGSLEGVNDHFFNMGWSDGHPIIPPTIDRVKKFLDFTDRTPDVEIAVLPPGKIESRPFKHCRECCHGWLQT